MPAGAPKGNKNGAKARLFEQALIREIKQRDLKEVEGGKPEGETLRKIAATWVDKALGGDSFAARDIRDTLDGKPRQQMELTGDPDNPIALQEIKRTVVRSPGTTDS